MSFYGDNSRWFIGEVKSISDPTRMGRVRVRIFGVHTDDEQLIPENKLPWAQVLAPVTEGGIPNQGNFLGIQPTARVFGLFLDGKNSQMPLVLGSIPHSEKWVSKGGIQSQVTTDINAQSLTNEVQDGYVQDDAEAFDETIVKPEVFDHETKRQEAESIEEPLQTNVRKNVYPNNKVKRTTSGHVIEVDDTPGGERLHVYHKSGTLVEIQPNGDIVTQHKNGFRSVTGTDKLYVTGDVEWLVNGKITISASKDITIGTAANFKVVTTGQQQYYSKGDVFVETDGAYNNISTDALINANGPMDIRGTRIDLAKADPIAPAPEDFAFGGITTPDLATVGGAKVPPIDTETGENLGNDTPSSPASPGLSGEPGDCTRKELGAVSAIHESKGRPSTIGFDSTGGHSYGTYQIMSQRGKKGEASSMDAFLSYINNDSGKDDRYTKFGQTLNNAGGGDAATSGNANFQNEWKRLANNEPDFVQAQHDFIQQTHHNPVVRKFKEATGIDVCDGSWSNGVQDAVWSTAVQHGPGRPDGSNGAPLILKRALARTGKTAETVTDEELIRAIYAERGKLKTGSTTELNYFGGSTAAVQQSVKDRFKQEVKDALSISNKTLNKQIVADATASVKGFGYNT